MTDLIYPSGPVPVEGGADTLFEMLPLVDGQGNVFAQAPRNYCHGGAKPLHPVVHLHVLNRKGELYLQQRAATKDLLPLYWDTAVGGHVSYGEYIMEALFRESSEELGLMDYNPIWIRTYEFESATERELVFVFAAVGSFKITPDREELAGGRFWTESEIEEAMGKGVLTPNFEQEYSKIKSSLYALL